jgi:hypothetical protein
MSIRAFTASARPNGPLQSRPTWPACTNAAPREWTRRAAPLQSGPWWLGALSFALLASCKFDRADRWETDPGKSAPPLCTAGTQRCRGALERCNADGRGWSVVDDCPGRGYVCAPTLLRCAVCDPSSPRCEGQTIMSCNADGTSETAGDTCDVAREIVCRQGICLALCDHAQRAKSNIGCEYWAADLDNANVGLSRNAAAQQFAVVVSNPQPDLTAHVVIEQDDALPGQPPQVRKIAEADVLPLNLETFKLGPREVDGSPEGQFNTGTGTALTRHAYRITSQIPIVAYQFNPLENFNVFSNDASLLKPVEALTYEPGTLGRAYVVMGWPQTIADTDDPNTNFNPQNPINLRAFLTLIGTRSQTHVKVHTATRIVRGGPVPATNPGGLIEATLEPFDVLNLETEGINADFTSSLIDTDQPLVVFSGSEASDAPTFQTLAKRYCCADHLEQQLDPIRTAGKNFVLAHTPSRTGALKNAGAILGVTEEPEYFRIMAVSSAGAVVETSLPPPDDRFELKTQGAMRELIAYDDVIVKSDRPITVGQIQAGQEAALVPYGMPGGDPSFILLPPVEQYRADYVFLTPDKYNFDFVVAVARTGARVALDGVIVDGSRCEVATLPGFEIYRCQLSFPQFDPTKSGNPVDPGTQNDGVHRVTSDAPVGVIAMGWDTFVSYGYAAGMQLETINIDVK